MQARISVLAALSLILSGSGPAVADTSKSFMTSLPKRIVGTVVGTVVGTPIALIRCTKRELKKQTQEAYNLGGVPKPLGYVTAGLFGVPSGLLCGAWYGTADGAADGFMNSQDKPFSKGTISLDKLQF